MDINTIKTMVLDEPNNMKLGKKIRSYFMENLDYCKIYFD